MAKADTITVRAPRSAKPSNQAFFTVLDTISEATRSAVAKAAQAMIRDQIKMQREKAKAAAAKEKACKPTVERIAKKAAPKLEEAQAAEPAPKKAQPRKAKVLVAA